jgi:hypothetical protein
MLPATAEKKDRDGGNASCFLFVFSTNGAFKKYDIDMWAGFFNVNLDRPCIENS